MYDWNELPYAWDIVGAITSLVKEHLEAVEYLGGPASFIIDTFVISGGSEKGHEIVEKVIEIQQSRKQISERN